MALFCNDNEKLQFRKRNYKYFHWQNFLRLYNCIHLYNSDWNKVRMVACKSWWFVSRASCSREFHAVLLVPQLYFWLLLPDCSFLGPSVNMIGFWATNTQGTQVRNLPFDFRLFLNFFSLNSHYFVSSPPAEDLELPYLLPTKQANPEIFVSLAFVLSAFMSGCSCPLQRPAYVLGLWVPCSFTFRKILFLHNPPSLCSLMNFSVPT